MGRPLGHGGIPIPTVSWVWRNCRVVGHTDISNFYRPIKIDMDALPVMRPTCGNLPPSAFNECIGDYALLEDFGPHRRLSILILVENTNRRYITGARIARPSGSSLSRKGPLRP